MDTIQCNYCGYRIPPGARYCPGCASPVEDDEKTAIMQRTPHPLPQAGAQPLNQGYGMPQQQPPQQPQQYPQGYSQPPYNQRGYNTLPSPPKKSKTGLIVLIAALALLVLGGGGWAAYQFVLKPALHNTSGFSADDDEDVESYSTDIP